MGISEAERRAPAPFPGASFLPAPVVAAVAAAAGPLAVAAAFCGLAAWSWGKWTDVHIDFGNELYIAWQISEGKALYLDMAHRNGPLSHYLNAAWFELFGVSLRTLVWCNLAILAAIVAMVWRAFADACGRLAATAACGVLLGVFAFSQYATIANYNYVTPYHHTQTHGIALTLGMLLALRRALRGGRLVWVGLAGAALGAVFLTKAELFVPAALAALAGLLLVGAAGGAASSRAALPAAFGAGAALPPLLAFAGLAWQMPARLALEGVLGNWAHLGALAGGRSGGIFSDPFYLKGAGLDEPVESVTRLVRACIDLAGLLAVTAVADHGLRRVPHRAWVAAALGGLAFAGLHHWVGGAAWESVALTLPLVAAISVGVLGSACWRRRSDRAFLLRWGPPALWSIWSLGLLAKTGLVARFHQYGFALSMPASLLLVAWLVYGLPSLARARWSGGAVLRAGGLAALLAGTLHFWTVSNAVYALKQLQVGSGADAIWTVKPPFHRRGARVARALHFLSERMGPDETLLVLPEGISINYWLRKENPTRFDLFLPTELDAFGRDAVLADLRAHPPDWVVFVDRSSTEFGVGPFGVDPANGKAIVEWVRDEYEREGGIGPPPFTGGSFGIGFWHRLGPAAGPSAGPHPPSASR